MTLKVGITGGIGSGKSTICSLFEMLGIPVFYSDNRAKHLMTSDGILIAGIKKAFGEDVYMDDGTPDRKKLASIVFNDAARLQLLNSLVHPAVFRDFDGWAMMQRSPYVLKEAAILFESGAYTHCDYTILVESPVEMRLQRVVKRDGISEKEVEERMNKQLSDEEKARLADFVILNDECRLIIPQVLDLHSRLLLLAEGKK